MKLTNLNIASNNRDNKVIAKYAQKLLDEVKDNLIGVEMGVAYGGGLELIYDIWGEHGHIYGYDTFEGHPKQLADKPTDFEASCMDYWYRQDVFGTYKYSDKYIQGYLDANDMDRVHLIKGLVREDSCKDLDHINLAFLDMDLHRSMDLAFKAVKDKMVSGGYLLMHDVVDKDHIPPTHEWYKNTVLTDPNFKFISDNEGSFIAVVQKI